MRNLDEVIDQMLEVIPADQERLIAVLKDHKSSCQFAAPELQGFWWRETAASLNDYIPLAIEPWQKQLSDIFAGKVST